MKERERERVSLIIKRKWDLDKLGVMYNIEGWAWVKSSNGNSHIDLGYIIHVSISAV